MSSHCDTESEAIHVDLAMRDPRRGPTARRPGLGPCRNSRHLRHAIDFNIERASERWDVQEDARWGLAWKIARVNVIKDGEVHWLGGAVNIALEHLRE